MILAYIDPATGAMILQILAAAVLAAGVYFRKIFVSPVSYLFGKHSGGKSESMGKEDSK